MTPEIAAKFHTAWYDSGVWAGLTWRGIPIRKNPFDLMVYQEILWETKPLVIIETGTQYGGSARYASCVDSITPYNNTN
jgi:cephalosporin hydroxylase